MNLVGYIRVSRVAGREGDSFISPDVQRDRIEAYAVAREHQVVDWETDLDEPGSRLERPGFQSAIAAVERGEAQGIIVAKLDRFARSVAGAAKSIERLEAVGGVLVAVDFDTDTTTPTGNFMRNVVMAMAQFELERIRESWETARNHAIARGVHISRVPPVGYLRGEDGRLVPDPDAAPIIQEVFRRRTQGASLSNLCDYLNDALPRVNGGSWSIQTLTSILARRTYLGEAFAGDVVNENAHEPLVSPREWFAAQAIPRAAIRRENQSLLAGLIRCQACGYAMTRVGGGRRGYVNYRCTVRHSTGNCPEPARISCMKADRWVLQQVSDFIRSGEQEFRASEVEQRLVHLQEQAQEADVELAAYRDAELISVIGEQAFVEGLRTRQERLDDLHHELLNLHETVSAAMAPELAEGAFSDLLDAQQTEQRKLLVMLIENVLVTRAENPNSKFADAGERMQILWRRML